MKSQRGVTATSMVIVIVVLIMLAGYSVLSSREVDLSKCNTTTIYSIINFINLLS